MTDSDRVGHIVKNIFQIYSLNKIVSYRNDKEMINCKIRSTSSENWPYVWANQTGSIFTYQRIMTINIECFYLQYHSLLWFSLDREKSISYRKSNFNLKYTSFWVAYLKAFRNVSTGQRSQRSRYVWTVAVWARETSMFCGQKWTISKRIIVIVPEFVHTWNLVNEVQFRSVQCIMNWWENFRFVHLYIKPANIFLDF